MRSVRLEEEGTAQDFGGILEVGTAQDLGGILEAGTAQDFGGFWRRAQLSILVGVWWRVQLRIFGGILVVLVVGTAQDFWWVLGSVAMVLARGGGADFGRRGGRRRSVAFGGSGEAPAVKDRRARRAAACFPHCDELVPWWAASVGWCVVLGVGDIVLFFVHICCH